MGGTVTSAQSTAELLSLQRRCALTIWECKHIAHSENQGTEAHMTPQRATENEAISLMSNTTQAS